MEELKPLIDKVKTLTEQYERIREQTDIIKERILTEHAYYNDGKRVTHSYDLHDEDLDDFYDRLEIAYVKAGLGENPLNTFDPYKEESELIEEI